MTYVRIAVALGLVTTVAAAADARPLAHEMAGEARPGRPAWDGRLMPPERVAPHVWVMRQPDRLWAAVIGNVTIIEQGDGVVLIDSGGSIPDGRDVVAAVRKLTGKPIKAVAITHWHNDHPLGLPAIRDAFPNVRIISTAATRDFIGSETHLGIGKADPAQDRVRRERTADTLKQLQAEADKRSNPPSMRRQYATEIRWIRERLERQMGGYAILPTEIVTDSLLLPDPVAPVELRFLGLGNTHGDLIAWLPRQRTVVTGDIVVLPTPYGFTNPIAPWLATLRRLEHIPFTTLVPGHGKVQHDRRYLHTLEWAMRRIAAEARAAAARPTTTKDQAVKAFDRRPYQQRFHATDPWTRQWLNDYFLEGMFSTAFDEARGKPAVVK